MFMILAVALLTSGCATGPDAPPMDPLEGMNRFFFDLNQRLDRHAALPAATAYSATVPQAVRRTLHNVIDNMGGPVTVANNILQIDFENAGIATARFVV